MRARFIIAAVLVLALQGCATDTYRIRWVKATSAEVAYMCRAKTFDKVWGCSESIGDICVVVTDVSYKNQEELLGHEVRHCFDGKFH